MSANTKAICAALHKGLSRMPHIRIKPTWTIHNAANATLSPKLVELLVHVQQTGNLVAACQALDISYRHGWDLVRAGEAHFNATLLHMARGKGSTLSALAEKLVWADHRINARLKPMLDSLASELQAELAKVITPSAPALRVSASYGFSIEKLIEALTTTGTPVHREYVTSTTAAAALFNGQCDACGIHIPMGSQQARALAHYAQWLHDEDLWLIDISTRRQGLMVAPGNPKKIYDLQDLMRPDVQFINRPADSGTRFLLEGLLQEQGLDANAIRDFQHSETTHAAVAAYVASHLADAGFGLERPARFFHLEFVPMVNERYFLVTRTPTLENPAMQRLITTLQSVEFKSQINALPGYDSRHCGSLTPWREAFAMA
jgi:molybdate transport repressor ModE-like protein